MLDLDRELNAMQSVGKKVKEIRESNSLTQKEVTARAADLSASYIANLENGAIKNPGRGKLNLIAKALGTSLNELLDGTTAKQAVADESKIKARVWCFNRHCRKAIV